eukprot:3958715-Amphidinium_carterae.2
MAYAITNLGTNLLVSNMNKSWGGLEREEAAWQYFKEKYLAVCRMTRRNMVRIDQHLSNIEAHFAARRTAAVDWWQRFSHAQECRQQLRDQ